MALDLTGFSLSWLFVRFVDLLFISSSGSFTRSLKVELLFWSFCTVLEVSPPPYTPIWRLIHLTKKRQNTQ
ncbi:hypothetical protein LDENG_00112930 [Lucifuga dentata]|nr:hypothetical protein LDENG_00112930 [Lucifuga dentata]